MAASRVPMEQAPTMRDIYLKEGPTIDRAANFAPLSMTGTGATRPVAPGSPFALLATQDFDLSPTFEPSSTMGTGMTHPVTPSPPFMSPSQNFDLGQPLSTAGPGMTRQVPPSPLSTLTPSRGGSKARRAASSMTGTNATRHVASGALIVVARPHNHDLARRVASTSAEETSPQSHARLYFRWKIF
ncbi:hypothetical protein AURDEDRAFT_129956 [Auricularia subglabra TFB-10046 SS5]|nr:hypothetical protein AURDEDRAFT_129956 [Auricularia subglabra TFB-10046 SS5]